MEINKVLLVDDEPDIRTIGELALREVGGWQVALAPSGAAALALVRQFEPDLILLDVMMPELDGPATLAALRDDPSSAAIPVIFMTAKVQRHEVKRYVELGALGVIAKPFDPMTLPEELRRLTQEL